ncbi:UNVERIFIED_CONTAM: hypothetical protein Sradi_4898000 [Sesamum radiatum]|uniref:Uncharacterized protein n=1 Tax=Sesamum radiatum TaxID=300843 RepID=A0AAW2MDR3_SESRA
MEDFKRGSPSTYVSAVSQWQKKEISLPIGRKGKTLRLSPCRCLTLFCSPVLSRPSHNRFPRLPSEVGGVVMNCPHVQPGPQALLWFDLSTFHIRGFKTSLPAAVGSALSSDGISTDNAGGWTPSRRIHGHLCYLPFFTEETSTQALGHRADLVRSTGHNPGQPSEFYPRYHKDHCPATAGATEQNGENSVEDRGERREKKREGSLEDLLGAVHFHLVAWYLETSLLAGAGVETSERALRERIVWRGEKFPVGVSDPPGLHLLVEEVGFLDIKVSRQSKKATSGSNRCFDHDSLLPVRACCHAGKSRGFGQFYLLLDLNQ